MISGGKDLLREIVVRPLVDAWLKVVGLTSDREQAPPSGTGEAEPPFSPSLFAQIATFASRPFTSILTHDAQPTQAPAESPAAENNYADFRGKIVDFKVALLGIKRGLFGGEIGASPEYFDKITGIIRSMEAVPGSNKVRIVLDRVRILAWLDGRADDEDPSFLRLDKASHSVYEDGYPERSPIRGVTVDIGPDEEILTLTFDSKDDIQSVLYIPGSNWCKM